MIGNVPEIVANILRSYRLEPGTGTPAGVGPVQPGDRLQGVVAGAGSVTITIGPKVG